MTLFDLSGKVAVVTGSTKGIGRGIVDRLAEHGATVIVSSRDQTLCEKTAAELNEKYGRGKAIAIGIAADLEDVGSLQKLVDGVNAKCKRIDILVCNAAVLPFIGPSADTPRELFTRLLEGNIQNTFRFCQMVLPQMKERRDGCVIIIGSASGRMASTLEMAYGLTKAAQSHMARSLAAEVAPFNVRVNCVSPGLTRSHSSRPLWENEKLLKMFTASNPLQRIGEPDDIAGGVIFLASQAGSFVTGETLAIDGGATSLPPTREGQGDLSEIFDASHRFN